MSGSGTTSTGVRSRTQGRRKPNDEAGYFGPGGGTSTAGVKRHAVDKAEGDGRAKRKRMEPANGTNGLGGNGARKDGGDTEAKSSLVRTLDFIAQYSRRLTANAHRWISRLCRCRCCTAI